MDDVEANLRPAQDLGITTIHAQQPDQTLLRLNELLGLPIAAL
ncbi:hypothetical protein ACGFWI_07635 [Streptomyces sp. NPDC048434]